LRNRFADRHADAPAAYPEINNATRLLRAAGDPEATNLWAGTGWRSAQARPAAEVVELLTP
jgi:nitronate monooxygenase